jgi:hypothetical protein
MSCQLSSSQGNVEAACRSGREFTAVIYADGSDRLGLVRQQALLDMQLCRSAELHEAWNLPRLHRLLRLL